MSKIFAYVFLALAWVSQTLAYAEVKETRDVRIISYGFKESKTLETTAPKSPVDAESFSRCTTKLKKNFPENPTYKTGWSYLPKDMQSTMIKICMDKEKQNASNQTR